MILKIKLQLLGDYEADDELKDVPGPEESSDSDEDSENDDDYHEESEVKSIKVKKKLGTKKKKFNEKKPTHLARDCVKEIE